VDLQRLITAAYSAALAFEDWNVPAGHKFNGKTQREWKQELREVLRTAWTRERVPSNSHPYDAESVGKGLQ
jgi:hypothetical protein